MGRSSASIPRTYPRSSSPSASAPPPWPRHHRPPRARTPTRPQVGRLPRELGRPGLPNNRDTDLAWVGELVFDLLGDIAGDYLSLDVVDRVRTNHHAHLAAGLHGEHLLHAVVLVRDLFESLQALHVRFQRLAARAGAATADRVGRLRQHGLDRPYLDLVVVRLDGVHDLLVLAVPAGDLGSDQRVAAFDLMGQRLADVVQQRAPLQQMGGQSQLGGHDSGDVRRLDEVLEYVLTVRRSVAQAPEQRDQLGMHVRDAELDESVLARPHAQLLHLVLAAVVDLLDALGVDAPVEDEFFQREPADLAADRVKAAQQHGLGGVVDDEVDPRRRFERTDVPAFAADDEPLHLIAGEVQDRNHRLGRLLARHALDRQRHDLAGAFVALLPGLGFDLARDEGGLALGLVLHEGDQFVFRLVGGQLRGPLQDFATLLIDPIELFFVLLEALLKVGEFARPLFEAAYLGVEPLLALGQPGFASLQILAERLDVILERPGLFFYLGAGGPRRVARLPFRVAADLLGLGLGPRPDLVGVVLGGIELLGGTPWDAVRPPEHHYEEGDQGDEECRTHVDSRVIHGADSLPRRRLRPYWRGASQREGLRAHCGHRDPAPRRRVSAINRILAGPEPVGSSLSAMGRPNRYLDGLSTARTWAYVWQSALRGVTPHCRNGKRLRSNEQAKDSQSGGSGLSVPPGYPCHESPVLPAQRPGCAVGAVKEE